MTSSRYVTLGLARVRTPWFSDVARWSTSGLLAMDFVKTVSAEEVRSRLRSNRRFSALLVDGGVLGVDRDLLHLAAEHGCAPIVVDDGDDRDWRELGATTTLDRGFGPVDLEAVLDEHATAVTAAVEVPGRVEPGERPSGFRARTVAVTGPGGTGASTMAVAIAQGMAADVTHAHTVVLADLALHADQAMLHDARDVIPGVLELVEAHRSGTPAVGDVRSLTFEVVDRRYRLLLGLRQHRDWTAIRPRALHAALDGLRQAFSVVVADVDDDLEDEALTGSADVEDRNALARAANQLADVMVITGAPGMKGAHSLLRAIRDQLAAGIPAERIVPLVNRAPRRASARAELTQTLRTLLEASHPGGPVLSPIFVPERRGLDDVVRDGAPLPSSVVAPVTTAVRARLDALDDRDAGSVAPAPVPVAVGSLGTWADEVSG